MIAVGNNVVVTDLTPDEKTAGGLFMPQTTDAALVIRGKIVAISNELVLDGDIQVKIGDLVQYVRHSAFNVTVENVKYRVLAYKDILVIE